jgi:hypothetical protein
MTLETYRTAVDALNSRLKELEERIERYSMRHMRKRSAELIKFESAEMERVKHAIEEMVDAGLEAGFSLEDNN